MSLNIKDPATHALARRLAHLTGESLTAAVRIAVEERLERVAGVRETDLTARLLEIGRDCAGRLKEPFRSVEHGALLYDERGLPR